MVCFRPMTAWPAAPGGAAGRSFVFSPHKSYEGAKAIQFPCGKCDGCFKTRADEWGVRVMHELQMHGGVGCFVTLTYSDEWLPKDRALDPAAARSFVRRVRRFFKGRHVLYILCGEYGDEGKRPHFHAILFGVDFVEDRYPWKRSGSGAVIYRSPRLEQLWPFGFAHIGEVTPKSAAYLARYTMKGAAKKVAEARKFDAETGEVRDVPQFLRVSQGIGLAWFEAFASDAFPSDFVVIEGEKRPVPRYYKAKLRERDGKTALRVQAQRKAAARAGAADQTDARLAVREELARLRQQQLRRSLDEGEGVS